MNKITPSHIDGVLYAAIAILVFQQGVLSGDEAAKYMSPACKFWTEFIVGSLAAGAGALKMFRSTTYADGRNGTIQPPNTQPSKQ